MAAYANEKLAAYRRGMRGKKAAVLGMGVSNTPLIEFLAQAGAAVTAFDRSEEEALAPQIERLSGLGVEYRLGPGYLSGLRGFDVVFRTPGIRPDIPELAAERERGARLTSEMEAFLALSPCPVFGVTGSDGKTTTATFLYEILKAQGYVSHLGGNIGRPLLPEIDSMAPDHVAVVELSSFQLMGMEEGVDVAVITNISPNHLDVHSSYAEYVGAKANIVARLKPGGLCVLNYDCDETRRVAEAAPGRVAFFSRASDLAAGGAKAHGCDALGCDALGCDSLACDAVACVCGSACVIRKAGCSPHRVVDVSDIRLVGAHNVENFLAAALAAYAANASFAPCQGHGAGEQVPRAAAAAVARSFAGVEHRIEFVRELGGVRYYNDSIATSPSRTLACLNAFSQRVVLVAGGKDKNSDYSRLGERIAEKARALVLCGDTSAKIRRALDEYISASGAPSIPVIECAGYEEAVKAARAQALPGDVVVLSPASTSFDRFKNFEERGQLFKRLVDALP